MTKVDYEKIGEIIDFVTTKLNDYMINEPSIILNADKQTDLLSADKTSIDNQYKVYLAAYYAGMLIWYSSNKVVSDGIIEYCNENTPLLPKELVTKLMKSDAKNKSNLFDYTKHLMDLYVASYQKRIAGTKELSVYEIPGACAGELLNERFNQKVSDYNSTLVVESFNRVLNISKG